jgi:hypothetical protein
MLGLENADAQIRLRIQQMQQEAEHDRLVRAVTSGGEPARKSLSETLGRTLILIGSRLAPNSGAQPTPVGNISVFPVSTVCCEGAAG